MRRVKVARDAAEQQGGIDFVGVANPANAAATAAVCLSSVGGPVRRCIASPLWDPIQLN